MPNESDRNWVKIWHKPFSFGRLVHRMWEIRQGLFMKEKEAKEEKYRENWLARQSRATQAEATIIGVEILKKQTWQKEGERTGAILQLKLNNICNSNTDNVTSTKSSTSMSGRPMVSKDANSVNVKNGSSILCNKMVPTEKNNSNNVTTNVFSTWRQMVSKESNITSVKNVSPITSVKNVSSILLTESIKLRRQMVSEETNNSNFDSKKMVLTEKNNSNNVTTNVSSTWRQMVSKESNITSVKNVSSITSVKNVSSILLTESIKLRRQMVSEETNNSNFDNVTSTESGTSILGRQMVLKEATKHAKMGKKTVNIVKKLIFE